MNYNSWRIIPIIGRLAFRSKKSWKYRPEYKSAPSHPLWLHACKFSSLSKWKTARNTHKENKQKTILNNNIMSGLRPLLLHYSVIILNSKKHLKMRNLTRLKKLFLMLCICILFEVIIHWNIINAFRTRYFTLRSAMVVELVSKTDAASSI